MKNINIEEELSLIFTSKLNLYWFLYKKKSVLLSTDVDYSSKIHFVLQVKFVNLPADLSLNKSSFEYFYVNIRNYSLTHSQ